MLLKEREGRIEVIRKRGKRRKQLLDDLNEKKRYRNLKQEAPDWFGRGYGTDMNECRNA
jgi:hypothetical protein